MKFQQVRFVLLGTFGGGVLGLGIGLCRLIFTMDSSPYFSSANNGSSDFWTGFLLTYGAFCLGGSAVFNALSNVYLRDASDTQARSRMVILGGMMGGITLALIYPTLFAILGPSSPK